MNNYKSFSELKEELGNNYDFKLYEMGISALKEIENLQQENKQLKNNWNKLKELFDIQKGSEEYKALQWLEFQTTNYKNDSIILHFYRILYNFILKLQLENKKFKKLKNNWEKLKEYIGSEWYCFDNESVEFEIAKSILNKIQELEQGSDSNVKD